MTATETLLLRDSAQVGSPFAERCSEAGELDYHRVGAARDSRALQSKLHVSGDACSKAKVGKQSMGAASKDKIGRRGSPALARHALARSGNGGRTSSPSGAFLRHVDRPGVELVADVPGESSDDTLGEEEEEEVGGPEFAERVSDVPDSSITAKCGCGRGAPQSGVKVSRPYSGLGVVKCAPMLARERSCPHVPVPAAIARTFGEVNNSMIDRRAWLEVEDHKHRYAKNLRMYYKEWDRRGQPYANFWRWLEVDPVELEECSRAQLEVETVHYCSNEEERSCYEVSFSEGVLYRRCNGKRLDTGAEGWIFVLRDDRIFAGEKKTDQPPRFHHSSFFAGECLQAAGLFVVRDGEVTRLYPHSGHYRPSDSHLLTLLLFFEWRGIDLDRLEVDVQLVLKVARGTDHNKSNKRRRKVDSPCLWTGTHTKHFLLVKRAAWASKLFDQLSVHPLVLPDE